MPFEIDFFISRAGADKAVAIEVAETLKANGYSYKFQDEHIPMGENFVLAMHDLVNTCRHMIALHSPAYEASPYCRAEWSSFLKQSLASGNQRRFSVLKVSDAPPDGLFGPLVYGSLHNVAEKAEREAVIIAAAEGRAPYKPPEPVIWSGVPDRNPDFTGRDNLIDQLHAALFGGADSPAALTQVQAIRGMGGVGKTQVAAEYAHRLKPAYAGVWWAPAETRSGLIASLAELGAHLDASLKEAPLEQAAKRALIEIGKPARPWLLIYDNVDGSDEEGLAAPSIIEGLLPPANVHLIVTTRWHDWGGRARELPVDLFAPDVATDYLLTRANRAETERKAAAELAETLGLLPLALEQAGAYIRRTGISFDSYRAMSDELIGKAPKGSARPDVFATFSLAIDKASRDAPEAEELMGLLAFLAPEAIPLDIITDDVMGEGELQEAVAALSELSLLAVEPQPAGRAHVSVHRLVQQVMRGRLTTAGRGMLPRPERSDPAPQQTESPGMNNGDGVANPVPPREALPPQTATALRLVADAFPADDDAADVRFWPRCALLLPHAETVAAHVGPAASGTPATIAEPLARLLNWMGNYLYSRADYTSAEPLMRRAFRIAEASGGPHHPSVAKRITDLAILLHSTHRFTEAEPLMRRALQIDEKSYGPDHPTVATDLNNLAALLKATNRLEEAEAPMRRALQIDEKSYGPDHPDVAIRLNNLAQLLQATNRLEEAEAPMRRALQIDEKSYGPEHPKVAIRLNNLAQLLKATNRLDEAEPLMRRALQIDEKSYGPDHPAVATDLNNLAALLKDTNRLDEAEPPALRAVAIVEASLPDHHPWVQIFRVNLAIIRALLAASSSVIPADAGTHNPEGRDSTDSAGDMDPDWRRDDQEGSTAPDATEAGRGVHPRPHSSDVSPQQPESSGMNHGDGVTNPVPPQAGNTAQQTAPAPAAATPPPEQWYIHRDGVREGPLTRAELWQRHQSGALAPTDLVCMLGMKKWVPASELKWRT